MVASLVTRLLKGQRVGAYLIETVAPSVVAEIPASCRQATVVRPLWSLLAESVTLSRVPIWVSSGETLVGSMASRLLAR